MQIRILTNALQWGDAVSTHCLLLARFLRELGCAVGLYAGGVGDGVEAEVQSPERVYKDAGPDDILLHQYFNVSRWIHCVERFPGWRIMMYHNITPPEFLPKNSEPYWSCVRGLQQLETLGSLYDEAYGMSEFSRRDLEKAGFCRTGVFPLLVDADRLTRVTPDWLTLTLPKPAGDVLLFIGRIAPNKRIEDLVSLLGAYRRFKPGSCLVLVGNPHQHPDYRKQVERQAESLGLRPGRDVIFTGKISEAEMVAHLRRADAFVCMSRHEGFCAPLIEAMAFGLPVFARDAAAVRETVGQGGVVWEGADVGSAARLLHEHLSDTERRRRLTEAARKRAAEFTDEIQKQRVRRFIEQFCGPCPRPAYQPRVSIVINTCNRAAWLDRCLSSLDRQTYSNFEVVVVNGPSTDNTADVLARYGSRVRAGSTPHRILSVSRNEGIALAQGEIVAFLDDDAVPADDWLEKLVGAFARPKVGAVGGCTLRMNAREIEFRNGVLDEEGFVRWNEPEPGVEYDWSRGWLNTVEGCNCAFRREALERIGGFDERIEYYHDEADVVMRLAAHGYLTEHRPDAVVYHEAAPSAVRDKRRRLNWYPVAKNTVYVALLNYAGALPRSRMVLRVARRLFRERLPGLVWQWRQGELTTPELVRGFTQLAAGFTVGAWRGLYGHGLYRPLAPADPDQFLRFGPRGKPFSVALFTQNLPEHCPGGIATYTIELARGLSRLGCRVHVLSVAASPGDNFRDGIWYHGVIPEPLAKHGPLLQDFPVLRKNLEMSRAIQLRLNDLCARWGIDIFESPNWDFEGLFALADARLPGVVRAHSPLFKVIEEQGWTRNLDLDLCIEAEGLLYRLDSAVTGSTRAILDVVASRYDFNGVTTKQIPLGLPAPGAVKPNPSGGKLSVLFVGRLEPRKGILDLFSAIPLVLDEMPDVEFWIAGRDGDAPGGGSYSEWFAKRCERRSEYARKVRFLGEVSRQELERLYASCDVFCAPSTFESFGLIYLEAMAHGKPVVACRVGGVPEVVQEGVTGLLVEASRPPALAEALKKLLKDPALRAAMGAAGRQAFERRFSAEAMAQQTLSFYRDVVQQWRASHCPVWNATPLDLRRNPDAAIEWQPLYFRHFLAVEPARPGCAVFGPYIGLPPGDYRCQYEIVLSGVPVDESPIVILDVFHAGMGGLLAERSLSRSHFRQGSGGVFDLFFHVPPGAPPGFEFRVHSCGVAGFYVGNIAVYSFRPAEACPHGATDNALHLPLAPQHLDEVPL